MTDIAAPLYRAEASQLKAEKSHIWQKQAENWFVEPEWCGWRLAEAEQFDGGVTDPCCGRGNMLRGAARAGVTDLQGLDMIDRGYPGVTVGNFLENDGIRAENFFFNPPFEHGRKFLEHALPRVSRKIVMVYPLRRLPAAGNWLSSMPLLRVWYLIPRPSMPPGHVYEELAVAGKQAGGGKQDFVALTFLKGYDGKASHRWLHRDRGAL